MSRRNLIPISATFSRWILQETSAFAEKIEEEFIQTQRPQETPPPPKCYICQAEHRVHDCPTMADSSPEERIQHAKNHRLCVSCLVRGHPTRECRSRNKCSKNGCIRIHHPLLHTDPPTNSGVASILDEESIMPVVRVQFKAANGKVREGTLLLK